MSDFKKTLRTQLESLQQGFDSAEKELREIITELSEAVKEVTQDLVSIELDHVGDSKTGRYFDVDVRAKGSIRATTVVTFTVSPAGYPIFDRKIEDSSEAYTSSKFNNKAELEKYLMKYTENTGSSLMSAVGLAYRISKTSTQGHDDEELPF